MERIIKTPADGKTIRSLRVGDIIYVSGTVFTARDMAHRYLLKHGLPKGLETHRMALYHCGPLVKRVEGVNGGTLWDIISAGPTTSIRMESLEHEFIRRFRPAIIIGKGGMGPMTMKALKEYCTVYCNFTGGAGVLAAQNLGKVKDVFLFDELGMVEAIWVFDTEKFGPLIVTMDTHGNSIYQMVNKKAMDMAEAAKRMH